MQRFRWMMRRGVLVPCACLIALISSACNRVNPSGIAGEWRFIYIQESPVAAPPRFDIVQFGDDNSVHLTDSLSGKTYHGNYTTKDGKTEIAFDVPEIEGRIKQEWTLTLQDMGSTMIINADGAQLAYQEVNRMSRDDLSGRWVNEQFGTKGIMTLGPDGSYIVEEGGNKIEGYYRLWRSGLGETMTLTYLVPERGAVTNLMLYNRRGDLLIMRPLTPHGPSETESFQWKLEE